MASHHLQFSVLVVCGILLFSAAAAADYNSHSGGVASGTTHVDYYLRGEMNVVAEEGLWRAQYWQQDLKDEGRQLTEEEETSSSEEEVEVEDYTPCANNKHDPKLCKHN